MRNQSSQWLIPLLLAAGAAGALWYYWAQVSQPIEAPVPEPPVASEPEEAPAPLHPLKTIAEPGERRPGLVPLPALDESDAYLKIEIVDIFGTSVEDLLAESGLIGRIVATVDNLPRSHVAERIRPVGRLNTTFVIDGLDNSGMDRISPENYRRYDAIVGLVSAADLQQVAGVYRRYYPLFQKAFVELGYPNGYFNDRLVEVIDHLLETPEVADPVAVIQPHVLYEFEDARLEALSSGQKLLLRMGSEHASTIKEALQQFRGHITAM